MGYNSATHSVVVENKHGPAFEVEDGPSDGLTIWFERAEWGDDRTRGTKLSAEGARQFAQILDRIAQASEPKSH